MAIIYQDIRQYDIGSTFELTVTDDGITLDLSSSSVKQIKFGKPDGVTETQTAAFASDGTDGKIKYVTLLDDLDVVGQWKLQAYVEMGGGKWHSTIGYFNVIANL